MGFEMNVLAVLADAMLTRVPEHQFPVAIHREFDVILPARPVTDQPVSVRTVFHLNGLVARIPSIEFTGNRDDRRLVGFAECILRPTCRARAEADEANSC